MAKKMKLLQIIFFVEKQLIKFWCTCQPLSFCKILKKFLEPLQSYEGVPFSGPKQPICPEKNFLCTNHYYYFHLPIGHFHCDVFKTSCQDVFKTFSRRLQEVLQKRLQDIFKTSSRRFENVFKTSSRRFKDVLSS